MRKRSLFLTLLLAVVILLGCLSCQTTFKENPPEHEMIKTIEVWPHEYYWLVETGVSSRVLGLHQPGEGEAEARRRVKQRLDMVNAQWGTLSGLDSAQAIIDHLEAHHLEDVAGAIRQTLDANQAQAPSGGSHMTLQASAIKQGLVEAYQRVNPPTG
jgi:hypothetical protein